MKKYIFLLLGLIAMIGCEKNAGDYQLKYEIGKRYQQRTVVNQKQKMNMGGGQMDMIICQTQVFSMSVLAGTKSGGRIIEMEWDEMGMGMQIGQKKSSYDSKKTNNNNPLAESIGLLIGTKIKIEFDKNYKVQSIQGLHDLMNKILKLDNKQAQETFKNLFSEKALKESLSQSMLQGLPTKPVEIGDSWNSKVKKPMGAIGKMDIDSNYTFDRLEQKNGYDCAAITFIGKLSMDGSSNDNPMNFEMDIKDGKNCGTTWFDPILGQAIFAASTQNLHIALGMDGKTDNIETTEVTTSELLKISDI